MPSIKNVIPRTIDCLIEKNFFNNWKGQEEWAELLQLMLEDIIKPYFEDLGLDPLGNCEYMQEHSPVFWHVLNVDKPNVSFKGFENDVSWGLNFRGLFAKRARIYGKHNVLRAWGISRKAEWLLLEVYFEKTPPTKEMLEKEKDATRKPRDLHRATEVVVTRLSSSAEAVSESGFTPQDIYYALVGTHKDWLLFYTPLQQKLERDDMLLQKIQKLLDSKDDAFNRRK